MPERKIKAVFYNYVDEVGNGRTATRGETVNLSADEAARGDGLNAFDGQKSMASDPAAGMDTNARQGGINTAGGAPEADTVPSEMTAEQIDGLSGDGLDNALEAADIDNVGGSLADGSLSADEKRAALKAQLPSVPSALAPPAPA